VNQKQAGAVPWATLRGRDHGALRVLVFAILGYRDLEEIMTECEHVTIWRWVLRYAPVLNQRIRCELRHPIDSWRVDETYVRGAEIGLTCVGLWRRLAKRSTSCY